MNLLQAEKLRDIIAYLEKTGFTINIMSFLDLENYVKIEMKFYINKELKK